MNKSNLSFDEIVSEFKDNHDLEDIGRDLHELFILAASSEDFENHETISRVSFARSIKSLIKLISDLENVKQVSP
ncbi:MAG: hypothetical protein IPO86_10060 [Saprospiraceae bacterium]|nr:hypothetical protein [Saprospiraceae bacterium]